MEVIIDGEKYVLENKVYPTKQEILDKIKEIDSLKYAKANKAVPPSGRRGEVMLMVPGHMIPTEKPHKTQPISPITGSADRDASR